jgi:hypothetical protein
MTTRRRDEDLMIVVAAELYAKKYNMPTDKAFAIFRKNEINKLIRKRYNALHTQALDESFYFADDVLKRKLNSQ